MEIQRGIAQPNPQSLEPEVSYLWCYVCKRHIRCHFLPSGMWLVECPKCTGECGTCRCELVELCLGGAGVFPEFFSAVKESNSKLPP